MKSFTSKTARAFAALALAGIAFTAAAQPESGNDIVIGQSISLSEGKNPNGVSAYAGIQLYLDDLNKRGGINGRKVTLKSLDDDGKPAKAKANAEKLIDEGAVLMFGSIESGPSMAVARVAEARGVILLGPMAGAQGLREPFNQMVFPVRASPRAEHEEILQMSASAGWTKFAFFHAGNEAGKNHLKHLKELAGKTKTTLVAELPYADNTTDIELDAYVSKMKEAGTQVVLNHGSPALFGRLVQASNRAKFYPRFMGVNAGSTEVTTRLGKEAVGLVFAQVVPSPTSERFAVVRDFRQAWKAAHPGKPPSHVALEGYITARTLHLVLARTQGEFATRNLIEALYSEPIDLGGMVAVFKPGNHRGLSYVDLTVVGRTGDLVH